MVHTLKISREKNWFQKFCLVTFTGDTQCVVRIREVSAGTCACEVLHGPCCYSLGRMHARYDACICVCVYVCVCVWAEERDSERECAWMCNNRCAVLLLTLRLCLCLCLCLFLSVSETEEKGACTPESERACRKVKWTDWERERKRERKCVRRSDAYIGANTLKNNISTARLFFSK